MEIERRQTIVDTIWAQSFLFPDTILTAKRHKTWAHVSACLTSLLQVTAVRAVNNEQAQKWLFSRACQWYL